MFDFDEVVDRKCTIVLNGTIEANNKPKDVLTYVGCRYGFLNHQRKLKMH